MVDKNESENAAAPSNDPASGAKARAVAFTFGRRAWAQLGLLVALAVVTVVALLQEPKPNPFEPVPSSVFARAWQMVRYPIEVNPFARLPTIPVNLNGVFFRKDSGIGWIVGDSGYIARSDDGGRTWVRGRIVTAAAPAPAKSSGLLGSAIAAAHAGEAGEHGMDMRLAQQAPLPREQNQAPQQVQEQEKGVLLKEQLQIQQQTRPANPSGLIIDGKITPGPTSETATPKSVNAPVQQVERAGPQKKDPQPKPPAKTTPAPPPFDVATANLYGIYFADDRRGVAVGERGTLVVSDDGGRTWRPGTSGTQASLFSIAHDGRRWVAVGQGGAMVTSENGSEWQARSSGTQAELFSVAHDGRRWVAVGKGGAIVTSENGMDWQVRSSGTQAELFSVAHDGRRWVAVGKGGAIVTSENGTDWQARSSGMQIDLHSVAYNGQRWVVVGEAGAIVTSENGINWQPSTSGTQPGLYSVVHFGRRSVVVGPSGAILISENGTDWQARSSGTPVRLRSVAYDGRRWVAVGAGLVDAIVTSDNSTDWQARSSGTPASLYSVAHDGRRWVAVGERGTVLTSDNGADWQARASGTQAWLLSVARDGRRWMAVGQGGAIVTSENGSDWQRRTSGMPASLYSVAHDGRRWVAVGGGGAIITSDNGADWQARTSGTQARLMAVAHDGRRWVAVGEGGTIITSENGADWQAIRYRRYVAGWYWLLCFALLGAVPFARRIREPDLRAQAPERTVADQVVSDAPVRSVAEDKLRFGLRVDGLSRYLRNKNTEPPLTLAINGPWGSGKSSFMRMLQADLERHEARTVWFNAWHLQKEEQLQAALLDAIRTQVPPPWWSPFGFEFRLRLFWKRTQAAPITALVGVMILAAAATYLLRAPAGETNAARLLAAVECVIAPPQDSREDKLIAVGEKLVAVAEKLAQSPEGASKPTAPPSSVSDKNAGKNAKQRCENVLGVTVTDNWWRSAWTAIFGGELGLGLLILLVGSLPALKALAALRAFGVDPAALKATLAGLTSRKALSEETAVRARFTKEFSTVTEALTPRILTIFIDDLDRCNEKQLMETLEAVNYLAESGRCYVILGMVEETVQRLVGLAVERLAAELAEQEQQAVGAQQASSAAQLEEAKRERRRRFAERYLEKLINIKLDVPTLSPKQAAAFVSQNKTTSKGEQLKVPGWIGGIDWLLKRARVVALPLLLIAGGLGSIWFASQMAKDGTGQQPAVDQTRLKPEPPAPPPKVPKPPSGVPEPPRPKSVTIALPDRVEPVAPGAGWMQWTGSAIFAGLLFLAFYFALVRRLDYNTNDSPAFSRALEIWSPLLLGKLATPRALKRFQNQLRFRAMALDALAAPPPEMPDDLGPLGKWFADRAQAQLEAERRFNFLLPEPFLVGLEALRVVFPESGIERLSDSKALTTAIDTLELRSPDSSALDELTVALARHDREVQDGKWPVEYRWPPQNEHCQRYVESFELAPRTAENPSRSSNGAPA